MGNFYADTKIIQRVFYFQKTVAVLDMAPVFGYIGRSGNLYVEICDFQKKKSFFQAFDTIVQKLGTNFFGGPKYYIWCFFVKPKTISKKLFADKNKKVWKLETVYPGLIQHRESFFGIKNF